MKDVDFDQVKRESIQRRQEHPDWPSHRPTLDMPGGQTVVYESMPVEKMNGIAYCKYCHQKHRNWWLMDQRDYSVNDEIDAAIGPIILCGECEYTSPAVYAGWRGETNRRKGK